MKAFIVKKILFLILALVMCLSLCACADEELKRIILFYVINTPCIELSAMGIPLDDYGWNKKRWRTQDLFKLLCSVPGLKKEETFFVAKNTRDMKAIFEKAQMKKNFTKNREIEKIAIHKQSGYCEFESVLYHIRNALAHGRFAMYELSGTKEVVFVLEDGVKKQGSFFVRARRILKKSTLLKWIDILECKTKEAKETAEKILKKYER